MAVPDSGNALSLAGIKAEIDNNSYSASATSLTSLQTIAEETTFNSNSNSVPNATTPHAMSEWYSYDHDAAAAFANAKAVSKTLSTGTGKKGYLFHDFSFCLLSFCLSRMSFYPAIA